MHFLPFSAIVVLTAILSQIVHGLPQVSATKSRPLTATRHALKPRQTAPYQPNPSNILWPPDCTTQDSTSCLGSSAVKSCTVEYCTKKVALTCWTHAYYIDMVCLCKSMSSTTCPSCNAGINHELYLVWLSQYCQLVPGWNGLPSNWNSGLPGYEILVAGQINGVSSIDSSHFQTNNPFTSQFITDKHTFIDNHYLPTCTSGCNWLNSKWTSSFVDGVLASRLDSVNSFKPTYEIGGTLQDGTLYVDLSVFCTGWVWADLQSNCTGLCNADLEPTSLLLWLNETCGQATGFAGLPDNWHSSLAIVNSTFSDVFSGPSCLQGGSSPGSDCSINATEFSCTRTLCGSQAQNGDCSAVSMVDMHCFCSRVKYSSCIGSGGLCSSGLDTTGLLLWLNGTCGSVEGFSGMPSNWESSLSVINSTYSGVDSFPWPSCLSAGNYTDCQLQSTESNCTRALCNNTNANGDCSSVSMIDMSCFCSDVKYGTSCTRNCALSWERPQFLNWLNDTCSLHVPQA
jgi:hypothetical protein